MRCFHFAGAAVSACRKAGEVCYSALGMGMIDDAEFQRYDIHPFGTRRGLWPVVPVAGAIDDEPPSRWLARETRDCFDPGSRLLVVAAGGGRELRQLSDAGYRVIGLEFDEALAAATRRVLPPLASGGNIEVLNAPRYEVPETLAGPFDGIVIGRFYLSYVLGRAARITLLERLRSLLRESGSLMADYFIRREGASLATLPFRVQPPVANVLRTLRGRRGRSRVEVGDHLDPEVPLYHHHFTGGEIESELSDAGYRLVRRDETWYGWVVARPIPARADEGIVTRSEEG